MAITHASGLRTTIATAVRDAIDAGAGAGYLEFQTSGDVEVATLTLSDPCGTVSGPTLTFSAITSDTSATGGTVAKFQIYTSAAAQVLAGAVGTSGSDINLSSLTVAANDTVSISSLSYTAPA